MLLEHLLTLDKPVNCRLTMSFEQQAQLSHCLTSSRHISPTVARTNTTNTKIYHIVANFVSVPSQEFISYMPYKARAVPMDSSISNNNTFPYGHKIIDTINRHGQMDVI